MKKCETCYRQVDVNGDRFCKECKKKILNEMQENGYLQQRVYGHAGVSRTSEQKENTYETKRGTGH